MLTLLIIPNKEYQEDALRLTKQLSAHYEKICYVSLNELYGSLKKTFARNGIPVQKFFVVDAITRRTDARRKAEGSCFFVSSTNSLIELSLAITDAMRTQGSQLLLFDSVSTLLIYESADIVTKFMHSLVGKIKEAGADSIFIALQSDIDSGTVKDLEMFVNETITMDEYNVRNAIKEKAPPRARAVQVPKPRLARRPRLALGGRVELAGEPVEVPAGAQAPKAKPAQTQGQFQAPKPAIGQKQVPEQKPEPSPAPKAVPETKPEPAQKQRPVFAPKPIPVPKPAPKREPVPEPPAAPAARRVQVPKKPRGKKRQQEAVRKPEAEPREETEAQEETEQQEQAEPRDKTEN